MLDKKAINYFPIMDNITYEPIRDDLEVPATRADLYSLFARLEAMTGTDKEPEDIIHLNNE
jgi:hypothetical protein